MPHYYFDSSALVKNYVLETGTQWVRSLCTDSNHTIYTIRISGAEIVAAFSLRVRTNSISVPDGQRAIRQFKADFQTNYQIIEITTPLINLAITLIEQHDLRGYDSVQLAGAISLHQIRQSLALPPLTLVCADNNLNGAAISEGLLVENPNLM
ncbi:MAG: type II toxin-antitoxin system VapC family toxin [Chloroflexi bacterium]|nr:type II toxin-antitoxin system VapC family toxin [Chloroflexota bacterium]